MKKKLLLMIATAILSTSLVACDKNTEIIDNKEIIDNHESKDKNKKADKKENTYLNHSFDWDIFKQLSEEDAERNIFISPLSISLATTMIYQGSGDETEKGIEKALGYQDMGKEKINQNYKTFLGHIDNLDKTIELDINNSIWIREGEEIKKAFIDTNKDIFGAYVKELDFKDSNSADEINGWIKESTKGKIDNIIEPPINQDTIMYLFNTIYFKGDWTDKFDLSKTFKTQFNMENIKSDIDMMSRTGSTQYGEGEDYKVVKLPYGKEQKISMHLILPNEDVSVNDFIKTMDSDKWSKIKKSIDTEDDLNLQIPKFKLEYGVKELNKSLSKLGMGDAFSKDADFSGIGKDIYLSSAFHKAVIEVSEEGSEVAAVTGMEMKTTSFVEPKSFIADRPFMFLILDDEMESILFMGKVRSL